MKPDRVTWLDRFLLQSEDSDQQFGLIFMNYVRFYLVGMDIKLCLSPINLMSEKAVEVSV